MLRAGIPPEMAQKEEAKFYVNNWVNQWISHSLEQNQKKRDGALEFEAISLLLKYGFPVNHIKDYKYDNRTSFTALDTVLMAKRLNPEIRQKMVDLLRSYNAKTYLELVTEDETLPHLDLSGIEVDPQFQKIVEILQHSEDAAGYRVSAHYPGLEGPLLVFDFLAASEAKQGKSHTKTIQFHRRKNNNEWNQTCESVEIPEYYRIILTPKGKKVPSQISPDWPRKKVLLEQWISLESCEMYVAFNPERHTRHIMKYRDLEAIVWTIVPPDMSKYDARRLFKYHEIPIDDSFFLDFAGVFNPEKGAIPSQPLMEAALQRANSKLAALGLPGKWHSRGINRFKLGGKQIAMGFVYSSIRTLEELKNTPSPIAPLPNEILILAWEKWPPEPMPERIVFREQYKECLGYWNSAYWEADSNYCKKSATILYGDNVSSETLNNISQTISELLQ